MKKRLTATNDGKVPQMTSFVTDILNVSASIEIQEFTMTVPVNFSLRYGDSVTEIIAIPAILESSSCKNTTAEIESKLVERIPEVGKVNISCHKVMSQRYKWQVTFLDIAGKRPELEIVGMEVNLRCSPWSRWRCGGNPGGRMYFAPSSPSAPDFVEIVESGDPTPRSGCGVNNEMCFYFFAEDANAWITNFHTGVRSIKQYRYGMLINEGDVNLWQPGGQYGYGKFVSSGTWKVGDVFVLSTDSNPYDHGVFVQTNYKSNYRIYHMSDGYGLRHLFDDTASAEHNNYKKSWMADVSAYYSDVHIRFNLPEKATLQYVMIKPKGVRSSDVSTASHGGSEYLRKMYPDIQLQYLLSTGEWTSVLNATIDAENYPYGQWVRLFVGAECRAFRIVFMNHYRYASLDEVKIFTLPKGAKAKTRVIQRGSSYADFDIDALNIRGGAKLGFPMRKLPNSTKVRIRIKTLEDGDSTGKLQISQYRAVEISASQGTLTTLKDTQSTLDVNRVRKTATIKKSSISFKNDAVLVGLSIDVEEMGELLLPRRVSLIHTNVNVQGDVFGAQNLIIGEYSNFTCTYSGRMNSRDRNNTYELDHLRVQDGGAVYLYGSQVRVENEVTLGGLAKSLPGTLVVRGSSSISATRMEIRHTGIVDGIGKGGQDGPGTGLKWVNTRHGASHGGSGGYAGPFPRNPGSVSRKTEEETITDRGSFMPGYGNFRYPVDVGCSPQYYPTDQNHNKYRTTGGAAIQLNVSMEIIVNGAIRMDASNGRDCTSNCQYAPAGASGGSVFLHVGKLSGYGIISANGGEGGRSKYYGQASADGGGGRIAIIGMVNDFLGAVQAYGGYNAAREVSRTMWDREDYRASGGAGTIYEEWGKNVTRLTLDNRGVHAITRSVVTLPHDRKNSMKVWYPSNESSWNGLHKSQWAVENGTIHAKQCSHPCQYSETIHSKAVFHGHIDFSFNVEFIGNDEGVVDNGRLFAGVVPTSAVNEATFAAVSEQETVTYSSRSFARTQCLQRRMYYHDRPDEPSFPQQWNPPGACKHMVSFSRGESNVYHTSIFNGKTWAYAEKQATSCPDCPRFPTATDPKLEYKKRPIIKRFRIVRDGDLGDFRVFVNGEYLYDSSRYIRKFSGPMHIWFGKDASDYKITNIRVVSETRGETFSLDEITIVGSATAQFQSMPSEIPNDSREGYHMYSESLQMLSVGRLIGDKSSNITVTNGKTFRLNPSLTVQSPENTHTLIKTAIDSSTVYVQYSEHRPEVIIDGVHMVVSPTGVLELASTVMVKQSTIRIFGTINGGRDLVIGNNVTWTFQNMSNMNSNMQETYIFNSLTVEDKSIFELNTSHAQLFGQQLNVGSIEGDQSTILLAPLTKLEFSSVVVKRTGVISGVGRVWYHPLSEKGVPSNWQYGGSFAGNGGRYKSSAPSQTDKTYGNDQHETPFLPGSRGVQATSNPTSNRNGGGSALHIVANETLIVEGIIDVSGGDGWLYASAGSGGSLYVDVNLLNGTGFLRANGGRFRSEYPQMYYGAGGGGGRMAVHCKTKQFEGKYETYGGGQCNKVGNTVACDDEIVALYGSQYATPLYGGPGTLFENCGGADKSLSLDNNGHDAGLPTLIQGRVKIASMGKCEEEPTPLYENNGGIKLTTNREIFQLEMGSFTVEAWVYSLQTSPQHQYIYTSHGSNTPNFFAMKLDRGIVLTCILNGAGNWPFVQSSIEIPMNTWTHVACVRTSENKVTAYVNGKAGDQILGNDFDSNKIYNILAGDPHLGTNPDAPNAEYSSGRIRSFRITKGAFVYEKDNFVPSTYLGSCAEETDCEGMDNADGRSDDEKQPCLNNDACTGKETCEGIVIDTSLAIGNLKLLSKGQAKFEPIFPPGVDTKTPIDIDLTSLVGDGTGKIWIAQYQTLSLTGTYRKSSPIDPITSIAIPTPLQGLVAVRNIQYQNHLLISDVNIKVEIGGTLLTSSTVSLSGVLVEVAGVIGGVESLVLGNSARVFFASSSSYKGSAVGHFKLKNIVVEDGSHLRFDHAIKTVLNVTDKITVGGQILTAPSQISSRERLELWSAHIHVRKTGALGVFDYEDQKICKEVKSDGTTDANVHRTSGGDLLIGDVENPVPILQMSGGLISANGCKPPNANRLDPYGGYTGRGGAVEIYASVFEGDGSVSAGGNSCDGRIDLEAQRFSEQSILLYTNKKSTCTAPEHQPVVEVNETIASKIGYDCSCSQTEVEKIQLNVVLESVKVFDTLVSALETGEATCDAVDGRSLQEVEVGSCTLCDTIVPTSPINPSVVYEDGSSELHFKTCSSDSSITHPDFVTLSDCHILGAGKYRQWAYETTVPDEDISPVIASQDNALISNGMEILAESSSQDSLTCKPTSAKDMGIEDIIVDEDGYYEVYSHPVVLASVLAIKHLPRQPKIFFVEQRFKLEECPENTPEVLLKTETVLRENLCKIDPVPIGECRVCKGTTQVEESASRPLFTSEGVRINGHVDCADPSFIFTDRTFEECKNMVTTLYFSWPGSGTQRFRHQVEGKECFQLQSSLRRISLLAQNSSNNTNLTATPVNATCIPVIHHVFWNMTSTSKVIANEINHVFTKWKRRPGNMFDTVNLMRNYTDEINAGLKVGSVDEAPAVSKTKIVSEQTVINLHQPILSNGRLTSVKFSLESIPEDAYLVNVRMQVWRRSSFVQSLPSHLMDTPITIKQVFPLFEDSARVNDPLQLNIPQAAKYLSSEHTIVYIDEGKAIVQLNVKDAERTSLVHSGSLNSPNDLAVDPISQKYILIADETEIKKVDFSERKTSIISSGGLLSSKDFVLFGEISSIAIDKNGQYAYAVDKVRRVIWKIDLANGDAEELVAGSLGDGPFGAGSRTVDGALREPVDIAVDPNEGEFLVVVERGSNIARLYNMTTGEVKTIVDDLVNPCCVDIDPSGTRIIIGDDEINRPRLLEYSVISKVLAEVKINATLSEDGVQLDKIGSVAFAPDGLSCLLIDDTPEDSSIYKINLRRLLTHYDGTFDLVAESPGYVVNASLVTPGIQSFELSNPLTVQHGDFLGMYTGIQAANESIVSVRGLAGFSRTAAGCMGSGHTSKLLCLSRPELKHISNVSKITNDTLAGVQNITSNLTRLENVTSNITSNNSWPEFNRSRTNASVAEHKAPLISSIGNSYEISEGTVDYALYILGGIVEPHHPHEHVFTELETLQHIEMTNRISFEIAITDESSRLKITDAVQFHVSGLCSQLQAICTVDITEYQIISNDDLRPRCYLLDNKDSPIMATNPPNLYCVSVDVQSNNDDALGNITKLFQSWHDNDQLEQDLLDLPAGANSTGKVRFSGYETVDFTLVPEFYSTMPSLFHNMEKKMSSVLTEKICRKNETRCNCDLDLPGQTCPADCQMYYASCEIEPNDIHFNFDKSTNTVILLIETYSRVVERGVNSEFLTWMNTSMCGSVSVNHNLEKEKCQRLNPFFNLGARLSFSPSALLPSTSKTREATAYDDPIYFNVANVHSNDVGLILNDLRKQFRYEISRRCGLWCLPDIFTEEHPSDPTRLIVYPRVLLPEDYVCSTRDINTCLTHQGTILSDGFRAAFDHIQFKHKNATFHKEIPIPYEITTEYDLQDTCGAGNFMNETCVSREIYKRAEEVKKLTPCASSCEGMNTTYEVLDSGMVMLRLSFLSTELISSNKMSELALNPRAVWSMQTRVVDKMYETRRKKFEQCSQQPRVVSMFTNIRLPDNMDPGIVTVVSVDVEGVHRETTERIKEALQNELQEDLARRMPCRNNECFIKVESRSRVIPYVPPIVISVNNVSLQETFVDLELNGARANENNTLNSSSVTTTQAPSTTTTPTTTPTPNPVQSSNETINAPLNFSLKLYISTQSLSISETISEITQEWYAKKHILSNIMFSRNVEDAMQINTSHTPSFTHHPGTVVSCSRCTQLSNTIFWDDENITFQERAIDFETKQLSMVEELSFIYALETGSKALNDTFNAVLAYIDIDDKYERRGNVTEEKWKVFPTALKFFPEDSGNAAGALFRSTTLTKRIRAFKFKLTNISCTSKLVGKILDFRVSSRAIAKMKLAPSGKLSTVSMGYYVSAVFQFKENFPVNVSHNFSAAVKFQPEDTLEKSLRKWFSRPEHCTYYGNKLDASRIQMRFLCDTADARKNISVTLKSWSTHPTEVKSVHIMDDLLTITRVEDFKELDLSKQPTKAQVQHTLAQVIEHQTIEYLNDSRTRVGTEVYYVRPEHLRVIEVSSTTASHHRLCISVLAINHEVGEELKQTFSLGIPEDLTTAVLEKTEDLEEFYLTDPSFTAPVISLDPSEITVTKSQRQIVFSIDRLDGGFVEKWVQDQTVSTLQQYCYDHYGGCSVIPFLMEGDDINASNYMFEPAYKLSVSQNNSSAWFRLFVGDGDDFKQTWNLVRDWERDQAQYRVAIQQNATGIGTRRLVSLVWNYRIAGVEVSAWPKPRPQFAEFKHGIFNGMSLTQKSASFKLSCNLHLYNRFCHFEYALILVQGDAERTEDVEFKRIHNVFRESDMPINFVEGSAEAEQIARACKQTFFTDILNGSTPENKELQFKFGQLFKNVCALKASQISVGNNMFLLRVIDGQDESYKSEPIRMKWRVLPEIKPPVFKYIDYVPKGSLANVFKSTRDPFVILDEDNEYTLGVSSRNPNVVKGSTVNVNEIVIRPDVMAIYDAYTHVENGNIVFMRVKTLNELNGNLTQWRLQGKSLKTKRTCMENENEENGCTVRKRLNASFQIVKKMYGGLSALYNGLSHKTDGSLQGDFGWQIDYFEYIACISHKITPAFERDEGCVIQLEIKYQLTKPGEDCTKTSWVPFENLAKPELLSFLNNESYPRLKNQVEKYAAKNPWYDFHEMKSKTIPIVGPASAVDGEYMLRLRVEDPDRNISTMEIDWVKEVWTIDKTNPDVRSKCTGRDLACKNFPAGTFLKDIPNLVIEAEIKNNNDITAEFYIRMGKVLLDDKCKNNYTIYKSSCDIHSDCCYDLKTTEYNSSKIPLTQFCLKQGVTCGPRTGGKRLIEIERGENRTDVWDAAHIITELNKAKRTPDKSELWFVEIYGKDEAGNEDGAGYSSTTTWYHGGIERDVESPQNMTLSRHTRTSVLVEWKTPAGISSAYPTMNDNETTYMIWWGKDKKFVQDPNTVAFMTRDDQTIINQCYDEENTLVDKQNEKLKCSRIQECIGIGGKSVYRKLCDAEKFLDGVEKTVIDFKEPLVKTLQYIGIVARQKSCTTRSQCPKSSRPRYALSEPWVVADSCKDEKYLEIQSSDGAFLPMVKSTGRDRYWDCKSCPVGADCQGPVTWNGVRSKFGWWRSYWNASRFFPCYPGVAAYACTGAPTKTVYLPDDHTHFYSKGLEITNIIDGVSLAEEELYDKCKNEYGDPLIDGEPMSMYGKKKPDLAFEGNSTIYCGTCNEKAGFRSLCPARFHTFPFAPGKCNCKTRKQWSNPGRECTREELSESCVQCRLCTKCKDNWTMDKVFSSVTLPQGLKCSKCQDEYIHVLMFIAGLLIMFLMISNLVEQNMNIHAMKYSSAVYRILMSHFQILSIIQMFEVKWPQSAGTTMDIVSTIANLGAGPLLNLDCLLGSYNIFMPDEYKKAMLWAVLPVVILMTYEITSATLFRTSNKDRRVVIFLVIMFLLYPHLVQTTFRLLSCIRLDEDHWFMNGDMDVQCYTDWRHIRYTMVIGYPMLFVYVLGIPAAAAIIVFVHRNKTDSIHTVRKLHVAVVGYRVERWSWSAISMLQKTAFVAVAVFAKKFGGVVQAYIGLLILGVCLGMHFIFKPYEPIASGYDYDKGEYSSVYKTDKLQSIEAASWMGLVVTLYGGWITVIQETGGVALVSDALWTTVEEWVLTGIIVVNVLFVVYASVSYALEVTRETVEDGKLVTIVHGCHRIHGKTKSKKAKNKLKKMSSIVVPSSGRRNIPLGAEEMIDAKRNSLSEAEAKLLRYARSVFPAGSSEYSQFAKQIMDVSRGDKNGRDVQKELVHLLGDSVDAAVLIQDFITAADSANVEGVDDSNDGASNSATAVGFSSMSLVAAMNEQEDIVESAKKMDSKQRVRASNIRKQFKLKRREIAGKVDMAWQFDGSASATKKMSKELTNVLKEKNIRKMVPLINKVKSNSKAAAAFANECDILNELVDEERFKAKNKLRKAIEETSNPQRHSLIEDALNYVLELEVPEVDDLVDEALEAFITAEHLYRSKQYIQSIPSVDILSLKDTGNGKNDSVITVVRATLLLLGTAPKEVTTWPGCAEWISKSGKDSLKHRVSTMDIDSLQRKKKTLKLVSKMLVGADVNELGKERTALSCYGFLCGVLAEIYPSYLSEKGSPSKKSTLSWGQEGATRGDSESASPSIEREPAEAVSGLEALGENATDSVEVSPSLRKPKRKLSRKPTLML